MFPLVVFNQLFCAAIQYDRLHRRGACSLYNLIGYFFCSEISAWRRTGCRIHIAKVILRFILLELCEGLRSKSLKIFCLIKHCDFLYNLEGFTSVVYLCCLSSLS